MAILPREGCLILDLTADHIHWFQGTAKGTILQSPLISVNVSTTWQKTVSFSERGEKGMIQSIVPVLAPRSNIRNPEELRQ